MAMGRSRTGGSRKVTARAKAAPRAPPFGRSLAMLLLLSREAVMQRWRPFLHERALTDQQWRVMRALREVDALEIVELGRRCCIHPASLSRILPNLESQGVISRRPNAADQRRVIVSLSALGRRLTDRIVAEGASIYAELARDVGQERLDHLYDRLEELVGLLAAPKPNGKTRRASASQAARVAQLEDC